jgi:hypothetical protein
MLAAVTAAIKAVLTSNIQSYTLQWRQVTRADLAELRRMRAGLLAQVQMARGGGRLPNLEVQFTPIRGSAMPALPWYGGGTW